MAMLPWKYYINEKSFVILCCDAFVKNCKVLYDNEYLSFQYEALTIIKNKDQYQFVSQNDLFIGLKLVMPVRNGVTKKRGTPFSIPLEP